MKTVVQCVSYASLSIGGTQVCKIGRGFVVLIGVAKGDSEKDAEYLARKILQLRVFSDEQGKLNLSVQDIQGELLAVSQFTLIANTEKGHRPSFAEAAPPTEAEPLFERFTELLRAGGQIVKKGVFREHMLVEIHNDGPITITLDTKA